MTPQDARQYAPATERNREPILEVLLQVLPENGTILEIASGTGEHAVFFASRLRDCLWLPTDVFPQSRASIIAWTEHVRFVD
jgi:methylase of polypeptide subunit release factors